jgi:hypothetical protein
MLEQWYSPGFFYITFQVMTLTGMSAAYEHTIRAQLKGLKNKSGFHPSAAHDPDYTYIRSIFFSGSTCQVGSSIGTPVT